MPTGSFQRTLRQQIDVRDPSRSFHGPPACINEDVHFELSSTVMVDNVNWMPKRKDMLFMAAHYNDGPQFIGTRIAEGTLWSIKSYDQPNAAATVRSKSGIGTCLRGAVRLAHHFRENREV